MTKTIESEYFDWLCHLVCGNDRFRLKSYYDVLCALHNREFTWIISNDENRAEEGIRLRTRFARAKEYDERDVNMKLSWSCSVLEMMIALAIRCEENIMDDPQVGDRTTQWFWEMIRSLGLMGMTDNLFDAYLVNHIIDIFLSRNYNYTGEGGLFTIKKTTSDLRNVEIWYQLCWYLDNINGY